MDKYSKHEFMIVKGRIVDEGPEFASYKRIYESIYGRRRFQIHRLEDILYEDKINYARFDGKRLAYLCLKDDIKRE